MEAVGSEVGQKMRSAIKAKLMELGCYVDDELPDYVMVMVANKRTRSQMEEDLQLFLTTNTHAFVNWLHQVLQKLQEVTINTSLVSMINPSKPKKLRKDKEKKKSKDKTRLKLKKSKKEKTDKEPKSTKLNIPPLLMNPEKVSSPSITDVFAGQILKSHGILLNSSSSSNETEDQKPILNLDKKSNPPLKRKRFPVIDPESVPSIDQKILNDDTETSTSDVPKTSKETSAQRSNIPSKTLSDIRIDEEDIIDIRLQQKDLNDFNDDSMLDEEFQSSNSRNANSVPKSSTRQIITAPDNSPPRTSISEHRNSNKRSLKDRLGVKMPIQNSREKFDSSEKRRKLEDDRNNRQSNSGNRTRSRITWDSEKDNNRHNNRSDSNERKKMRSRIIPIQSEPYNDNEFRNNITVSSVIRAPPKPKPTGKLAPPTLLLRAVAETHKSLLSKPPKVERDFSVSKKSVTTSNFIPKKIIIQVPSYEVSSSLSQEQKNNDSDVEIDIDTESLEDLEDDNNLYRTEIQNTEYVPEPIVKNIKPYVSVSYAPTHISPIHSNGTSSSNLSIHINSQQSSIERDPQFVVTLDGVNTNLFLEKKLVDECGDSDDLDNSLKSPEPDKRSPTLSNYSNDKTASNLKENNENKSKSVHDNTIIISNSTNNKPAENASNNFKASVNKKEDKDSKISSNEQTNVELSNNELIQQRKKNVSPIIFNRKEVNSQKTITKDESKGTNKYDSLPVLPAPKKRSLSVTTNQEALCKFYPDCKLGASCEFYHPTPLSNSAPLPSMLCTAFPACPYRDKCAYSHPPCKYGPSCIKRDCPYSHTDSFNPRTLSMISNVIPTSAYKSTSSLTAICKYYPSCSNINCHFYHPKPCRFGKFCLNKKECNFYHYESPSTKWKNYKN